MNTSILTFDINGCLQIEKKLKNLASSALIFSHFKQTVSLAPGLELRILGNALSGPRWGVFPIGTDNSSEKGILFLVFLNAMEHLFQIVCPESGASITITFDKNDKSCEMFPKEFKDPTIEWGLSFTEKEFNFRD